MPEAFSFLALNFFFSEIFGMHHGLDFRNNGRGMQSQILTSFSAKLRQSTWLEVNFDMGSRTRRCTLTPIEGS